MTGREATAEIFYTAFKALPKEGRDAVVLQLSRDRRLREDQIDLAIVDSRIKKPSRSFWEYLKEREGR